MATKIEVLDKIMGSGKTTSILNWCEANPDTPYLYVTPLLSESEDRVVEACVEIEKRVELKEQARPKIDLSKFEAAVKHTE